MWSPPITYHHVTLNKSIEKLVAEDGNLPSTYEETKSLVGKQNKCGCLCPDCWYQYVKNLEYFNAAGQETMKIDERENKTEQSQEVRQMERQSKRARKEAATELVYNGDAKTLRDAKSDCTLVCIYIVVCSHVLIVTSIHIGMNVDNGA